MSTSLPMPAGMGYDPAYAPSFSGPSLFGQGGFGGQVGGGLLGAAAGFFPTPTTSTMTGSSSGTSSGTINPILSQGAQQFLNQLQMMYGNYMNQAPNLTGYQAQQGNLINQGNNQAQQAIQQQLAARGLSTSPVASSIAATQNQGRIGQLNTLNQSIPLLQRQLTGDTLAQGTQFFSQIPRGTQSNQQQQQNIQQTTKTSSGGGIGGLLSGLGSVASLFSDKRLKKDERPLRGTDSIKLLNKLSPIEFKWKENNEPGHGFYAQDVKGVLPKSVVKDDKGFHRLDMIQTIPHIISAIQELSGKAKEN